MRNRQLLGMTAGVMAFVLALGIYSVGAARPDIPEVAAVGQAATTTGGGISVGGEGSVDGRPDTAHINLGFTAENASVEKAKAEAAQKMNAVLNRIKALGIAARDIQTSNFNIWRDTERKVFVVSNDVSVTIRNINSTSKLLDGAVVAGANSVSGISFGIEDRTTLEKQAREKAVADAKAKATELARITGVGLGAPTAISEGAASLPIVYPGARDQAMAGEKSTPIEPGQMKVSVSVQVTYAIR